ncbi:MAG: polyribonucleotide nucleotidyltransferase [Candidatus Omnitrophota bacterium]|nr:MAG: polyribonucleotide nucleotidyltransferase [Candidatus Omnitrophota bacterium]
MIKQFKLNIGNKTIILESGKLAKQASGAVTVTCGGTMVLVTVVMSKEAKEEISFFPLWVEYREKTYAAGKIPGGFFKREGRPTEKEILSARLIDRPIRPLFPEGMLNEVQVMATVLSSDGENDPDVLAVLGASAALSISDVPFDGPIGVARVGQIKESEFIINPTYAQLDESRLDIVIAGTKDGIIMIESNNDQVPERDMFDAIKFGYANITKIIDIQNKMISEYGVKKFTPQIKKVSAELLKRIKDLSVDRLIEINSLKTKEERIEAMDSLSNELTEKLVTEESPVTELDIKIALQMVEKELVRDIVLNQNKRVDDRAFEQIRPISCEIGVLPRTHGSALFTRGQTQSLSVTTLGTSSDEQLIEALEGEMQKTFMLHYNFPPFSVGEVKPVRGPGRREIGHGALAEKALKPVMPSKEEFPYTIRVVSDILESNGSSSMATICAGSLALMDGGVPIKEPVAGIAIGLVKEDTKYRLLTDIAGVEDHYGDMDFKIAGTAKGVTVMQLDVKLKEGISLDIAREALKQAKAARGELLDKMNEVISKPKPSLSEYAPRITTLKIDPGKIRDVIGPGGKTIRKIINETGVTIDIEDDGAVLVASTDASASEKAVEIIKKLIEVPEVGKIYLGIVKRVMPFGAFCEILPGREGLVHISELSKGYVKNIEDVVKIGDKFKVKVVEIDEQGRVNLSKKQAEE